MPRSFPWPLEPMEARSVDEIPTGPDWQYEPKWDGFRCLVRRDGSGIDLQSKSLQPLARYFPDLVDRFLKLRPRQFVLDGEIVLPVKRRLSFDELLQRIHPAESRVRKLADEYPAMYIVFDLLQDERGHSLLEELLSERRAALERFAKKHLRDRYIPLSPATKSPKVARQWFRKVGGNLDGIVAKRIDLPYQSGTREGMQKIKHLRTCDCVVGGFRYAEKSKLVGSLLLGLYDDEGLLHHVGFTSGIKATDKPSLTKRIEKLIKPPGFTGQAPGGPSRWSTRRSSEWQPLASKLVVEVQYDHFTGGRFRHGTRLLRWRPDKAVRQCTLDQVTKKVGNTLKLLERQSVRTKASRG
jgi:ATP-dependent DNA ligase